MFFFQGWNAILDFNDIVLWDPSRGVPLAFYGIIGRIRPFASGLDSNLIGSGWRRFKYIVNVPMLISTKVSTTETERWPYSSIWRPSNDVVLLQIGQVHVGACSWSWRKDAASKHRLWVQSIVRQGTVMRSVDRGHFKDITLDVATMSVSSALLFTRNCKQFNPYTT